MHSKSTDVLLVLVGLHFLGVLYASWRHRENLVAAMVHGRKRSGSERDTGSAGAAEGAVDEYRSTY